MLLSVLGFVCAKISRRSPNVFLKLAELIHKNSEKVGIPRAARLPSLTTAANALSLNGMADRRSGAWIFDSLPSMAPRAVHLINRPPQFGYVLIDR